MPDPQSTSGLEMTPFQKAEMKLDAALFREFKTTPYYKAFTKYAELLVEQFKGNAITGTKETFDYYKGAYFGASDAIRLPDTIIQLVESWNTKGGE